MFCYRLPVRQRHSTIGKVNKEAKLIKGFFFINRGIPYKERADGSREKRAKANYYY
jgi:hypothetical protein